MIRRPEPINGPPAGCTSGALPQQIAVDYRDINGIDAFAVRRRREFAGKTLQVGRLTGFCLLARREVLDKIGGFDERYGIGYFDDDDLSVRARQAGFELLVALNVFVHHFGSRTFAGLGIDCREQLRRNFEQFKAKWGPEQAGAYRLQDCSGRGAELAEQDKGQPISVPSAPPRETPPRVSLTMIVKDEEENLPACLQGLRELFHEIVVVDTGSTDRTKEVAVSLGARVFDFPWVDSFAVARNEALLHATGNWIFWLDADDRIDEGNHAKLRALFKDLPDDMVAYSMKCLCPPDPVHGTATSVDHIRLFRNHPNMRWEYRVHEQILPSVRRLKGAVRWADVTIRHVGYQDPALRRRKLERDLRLLQMEDAEKPDHPFTLFNLGMVFQELGQVREALARFQRSLERSEPGDSIVRKLYALIVQCHRNLGETQPALAACQAGRGHYPEDCELLFQQALLLLETRNPAEAERCFLHLLEKREGAHFASLDLGLQGYKARHNLAVLYYEQGRLAEAEAQWRAALAEQPNFAPARGALEKLTAPHAIAL